MRFNRLFRSHILTLVLMILVFGMGAISPATGQSPNEILMGHDLNADAQSQAQNTSLALSDQSAAKSATTSSAASPSFGLAIMSDLHVANENLSMLKEAVKTVNGLPGINAVAITGDLCHTVGNSAQIERTADLVKKFTDPVWAVIGNHDFIYQSELKSDGKKKRGSPAEKKAKLARFQKLLNQKSIRFSRKVGGHLLVFLPIDALGEKALACLSETTLTFFRETLEQNPKLPTIVFCHAPLEGSYEAKTSLGDLHGNAQPAKAIRNILDDNPQVFLWVAGHIHFHPSSKDFTSKANKVGHVTVIHVPNVPEQGAWIRVLKLTPEKAIVRTYDVKNKKFLSRHDRTFEHKNTTKKSTATSSSQSGATAEKQTTSSSSHAGTIEGSANQPDIQALFDRLKQLQIKLESLFARLLKLF